MNLDNLITPPEERRNDPKAGNAEKLQSIGRTAERIKRKTDRRKPGQAEKGKNRNVQTTPKKRPPKQGETTPKAGRTENGNKGKPRPKGRTARTEQKAALFTDESRQGRKTAAGIVTS